MGHKTPEYVAWVNMRARCRPGHPAYRHYGGRGIAVSARWDSFDLFLQDVGPRPTSAHSIDRIDNDGDYAPGNVRWATKRQQALNRREYGVKLTPEDRAWIRSGRGLVTGRMMAEALGVSRRTICSVLGRVDH